MITPLNQKLLVSSLCRSSKETNKYLKWLVCAWCSWKRKAQRGTRKWKAKTLTVSMGLWKSSWCTFKGHDGSPSGGEVLLSLQQPQVLYLQLPTSESLEREYTVKLQGGDGIEEGSPDPSDEDTNTQEPPGGGSQCVHNPCRLPS